MIRCIVADNRSGWYPYNMIRIIVGIKVLSNIIKNLRKLVVTNLRMSVRFKIASCLTDFIL